MQRANDFVNHIIFNIYEINLTRTITVRNRVYVTAFHDGGERNLPVMLKISVEKKCNPMCNLKY